MMIDGSTPHRVLKIGELTRLITSQLIDLEGRKSAVNLACASRYLEEPVLSTLWEGQPWLTILLKVLPGGNYHFEDSTPDKNEVVRNLDLIEELDAEDGKFQFRIVGDPSPEAWKRVHRYAAWMHLLFVLSGQVYEEATFRELRLNSPAGGWFPALQGLAWTITESNISHTNLFFSLHLKKISIRSWFSEDFEVPHDTLSAIAAIIPTLPTSNLQYLDLSICNRGLVSEYFKDAFSSLVLRCGPSLTKFFSPTSLSDAAMDHLIRLPHLHTCLTTSPPPSYSTSPLPLTFPPLVKLTLKEGTMRGWLSFFERMEHGASTVQSVTPLSEVKESLTDLSIEDHPGTVTDVSFATTIQIFRNLVDLRADFACLNGSDFECTFKLNNDNITDLAMALPRLRELLLGRPCSKNTCSTTVACLLPISIHCIELQSLQVHFNTTNIIDDFKDIRGDPRFQELHSRPRCALSHLSIANTPLGLSGSDLDIVGTGMIDIFPSLVGDFNSPRGGDRSLDELQGRIRELQER